MKRFLALVLTVGMLCGALTGCVGDKVDAQSESSTTDQTQRASVKNPIEISDGAFVMTLEQFVDGVNGLAGFDIIGSTESWNQNDSGTAMLEQEELRVSLARISEDKGVTAVLIECEQGDTQDQKFDTFTPACEYAALLCGGLDYTDENVTDLLTMMLDSRREKKNGIITMGHASCTFSVSDNKETFMIIPFEA